MNQSPMDENSSEINQDTPMFAENLEPISIADAEFNINDETPDSSLDLAAQIEAIVFASPSPIQSHDIVSIIGGDKTQKQIESLLDALVEKYAEKKGGFALEYIKGHGYQFRTTPAAASLMEKMFASRPRPISRAALETLAIIAYRQPATRAEIEFIRGVDAGSIIKNLLDRNLVACVGRKEDAGRPMLFGTTQEFLKIFRLNSLDELPSLQSFQPPREMMEAAMAQLEPPQDVNLEDYVGDEDREALKFSQGLFDENTFELPIANEVDISSIEFE